MELTAASLIEQAERDTGLTDWGSDDTWRTGLDQVVSALGAVDHFEPVVEGFAGRMGHLLSTRLRLGEDARLHPEIVEAPIERPVILIGLARTGTTILHDLLALDPAARAPREWETAAPWPAPDLATWDSDPRIGAVDAQLEQLLTAAPQLRSMHPWGARLPSDCLNMMAVHFVCASFWAAYSLDQYARWMATEPAEGLYVTHRRVLQQLQWKGPRGRWTLKEPTHQLNLPDLFAAYPDACFVQTHREPARTFASTADLVYTIQAISKPDRDRHDVGRSAQDLFGAALERSTAARDADPKLDAAVLDIAYADTVADPVGQVRRIHERFELPFSDEHAKRIEEHMQSGSEAGAGKHAYKAEDYGLDTEQLSASFSRYRERFGALLSEPQR